MGCWIERELTNFCKGVLTNTEMLNTPGDRKREPEIRELQRYIKENYRDILKRIIEIY